jgi:hypothetical protein
MTGGVMNTHINDARIGNPDAPIPPTPACADAIRLVKGYNSLHPAAYANFPNNLGQTQNCATGALASTGPGDYSSKLVSLSVTFQADAGVSVDALFVETSTTYQLNQNLSVQGAHKE